MISRIDLRGDALPEGGALRDLLPRADFDVEAALEKVRPICEDVRHRGDAALIDYAEKFDGVRLDARAGARRGARRRPGAARPAGHGQRWRSRSAAPGWSTASSAAPTTPPRSCPGGTVTEKWVPVGPGRALRAGRPFRLPVLRDHERGARPGGRCRVASRSPRPPQRRSSAGLPHPTILAACALLGVDEVYAAGGAHAVAMFAYGTESCAPANMVTGPGNIWVAAAKRLLHRPYRHRRRGRSHRDRGPRRRHRRPGARRRRPDQPGRARPAGRRRPGHRLGGARRRGREGAGAAGRRHQARRGPDRPRARGPAVRDRPRRLPRRRACRWSTRTPPSTWRSRPRTPPRVAARVRNAGAVFVGP